jgi:DNA-binding transcriptional regulator LsrR (DeoR family)
MSPDFPSRISAMNGIPCTNWVARLKAEQVSHSKIARRLGIGRTSVRRILTSG